MATIQQFYFHSSCTFFKYCAKFDKISPPISLESFIHIFRQAVEFIVLNVHNVYPCIQTS